MAERRRWGLYQPSIKRKSNASLGLRAEGIAINEVTFQGGKETFAQNSIVNAIAGRTHRRPHPSGLTAPATGRQVGDIGLS